MVGTEDDAGLIPRAVGYLFDFLEGRVLEVCPYQRDSVLK